MLEYFLTVMIIIGFPALLTWIIAYSIIESRRFKKDPEGNPHRRFCKSCGQCQEEYGAHYYDPRGWWEDVGPECDPDCNCHKYARNI